MKKIYIRENQINKDLLLPQFLYKAVRAHDTSLGDNPAFPSEDAYAFDYTILKERYREVYEKMHELGLPTNINTDELTTMLGKMVTACREAEKPIIDSLEKICENTVNRIFAIPDGAVNIKCKLVDKISYKISLSVTPEVSSDKMLKFKDINDFELSKAAIAKRRFINALIMGASEILMNLKEYYQDEINKINPELLPLYDKIMALNEYILFVTEEQMNDDRPKQGSYVEVHVGSNENKSTIEAQGVIFPLLLHDTLKGLFELFSVHGLPEDIDKRDYIIKKSDFLLAEPWDMRLGVPLWNRIFGRVDEKNIIPYIFMYLVKLPTEEFNQTMKELLMNTERGDEVMNELIATAQHNDGYQKFKNRINARNVDRSVIADSYFTAAELDGYDIDGDDIYDDDIIEEGKDYSALIHHKFQDVPSEVVDKVLSIDPTKKKSYSQWLLSHWDIERNTIIKNLKNGRIEQLFQFFKGNNDVQIKDYGSVGAPLQEFVPEVEGDDEEEEENSLHRVLTKSDAPTTLLHNHGWTEEVDSELANDFDIVFNEDDWIIAVPNTYEADCKLGENMYWCTAGGRTDFDRGRDYYDRYLDDDGGKYYVNFDMRRGESRLGVDYPFTRYQFHFESKQFMDKEDERVTLDEIDMPESAKDFYESEGCDTSLIESTEARMYAYEEERDQDSYYLDAGMGGALYLNQEYDNDYEYTEPDADTPFYVFGDDGIDPISYTELNNPHFHDDVVVKVSEKFCVFNTKSGDEVLIVVYEIPKGRNWGNWEGYEMEDYVILPGDINGIFGWIRQNNNNVRFAYISEHGKTIYESMDADGCYDFFINEPCTKADAEKLGRIFVEVTVEGGYHSLFAISPADGKLECIVRRDVPGDNCYTMQKGVVVGAYKMYPAYSNITIPNQTLNNYDLYTALPNGDYIICVDGEKNGEKVEKLNILKKGTNKPLLDVWFDTFLGKFGNTYAVIVPDEYEPGYSEKGKVGYFDINGQQIGEWYEYWGGIDKESGTYVGVTKPSDGQPAKYQLIDVNQCELINEFKNIKSYHHSAENGKIIVVTQDGQQKCYDCRNRNFCHTEFESWSNMFVPFSNPNKSLFVCKLTGSDEYVIFDAKTEKIILRGLSGEIGDEDSLSGYYKLGRLDGKINIFSTDELKLLLPFDVDTIEEFISDGDKHVCLYVVEGTRQLYDFKTGELLLKFNANIGAEFYTWRELTCFDEKRMVSFALKNEELTPYHWRCYTPEAPNGIMRGDFTSENIPPEIVELYNAITGSPSQGGGQAPAYATTESYDRLSQIISEAIAELNEDDIYNDSIIEEGKDYPALIRYKFQDVPSEVVDKVLSIDPTKKKSYSQWLLSHWDIERNTIIKNLKNGRIEQLFQFFKGNNDVQIKDYGSVGAPLQEFVPEVEGDDEEEEENSLHRVLTKSDAPTTLLHNHGWTEEVDSELANDFDIVFNEDDWIIAVPNTYEADCKLGENMYWCTAGGRTDFDRGRDYYDRYLDDDGGKYYVNFDMRRGESRLGVDYPFTRYQFHFESKQFMDKEDERVTLDEIDMPESAKDFYASEGYDPSDFESVEQRMERYESQRWTDNYRINDDLYLNQSYDDDFEYREPDEDTDFYLFSEDDDRDPISWCAIPNPHYNNDVILEEIGEGDIYIIRTTGSSVLAVTYAKTDGRSYERWCGYKLDEYMIIPSEIGGIFGIIRTDSYNNMHNFIYMSSKGVDIYNRFAFKNWTNMFINEQCTKADAQKNKRVFVEAEINGFRSLFAISPVDGKLECIVRKDAPSDGNFYTMDERGFIVGRYKTYVAYSGMKVEGQVMNDYDFYRQLPNGDYIISVDEEIQKTYRQKYNILKKGADRPLLNTWFDEFIELSNNAYLVGIRVTEKDGNGRGTYTREKYGFFNVNTGEQIGELYDKYEPLDDQSGWNRGCTNYIGMIGGGHEVIINTIQCRTIADFKNIYTGIGYRGKYMVETHDGEIKYYDIYKNAFCHEEFKSWYNLSGGVGRLHSNLCLCDFADSDEKVIFDMSSDKTIIRGLSDIDGLDTWYGFYTLIDLNGKKNALDARESKVLLPSYVDRIEYFAHKEMAHICLFIDGNERILYNYATGEVMLHYNKNIRTSVDDYRGCKICCYGEDCGVVFRIVDESIRLESWGKGSNNEFKGTTIDANTPPEVVELYNVVTGNKPSQGGQSPVQEPAYTTTEVYDRLSQIISEAIAELKEDSTKNAK